MHSNGTQLLAIIITVVFLSLSLLSMLNWTVSWIESRDNKEVTGRNQKAWFSVGVGQPRALEDGGVLSFYAWESSWRIWKIERGWAWRDRWRPDNSYFILKAIGATGMFTAGSNVMSFAFLKDHPGYCWRAGWKDGYRHRHKLLIVAVAQVKWWGLN